MFQVVIVLIMQPYLITTFYLKNHSLLFLFLAILRYTMGIDFNELSWTTCIYNKIDLYLNHRQGHWIM